MSDIINTTDVQKKIGQITSSISQKSYIVTCHGKGKLVILPYFNGCDENITDYIEDFQMYQNKEKLQKKYLASFKSGKSSLRI